MPSSFSKTLRPVAKVSGRVLLTGIVLCVAAALLIGGRGLLAARAEAVETPDAAPASPVAVARIVMEDGHEIMRRFSGQIEARQRTGLSFEQAGTIAEVLVREGEAVTAGQVVARLDTRLPEAERDRLLAMRESMAAQVELARRTNERQAELRTRGFASDQRVDDTGLTLARLEAERTSIDAALAANEIVLAKAELRAPFAGTILTRTLDAGAIAAPGAPVVTLTEAAPPRFHVGLDPALAARLAPGQKAVIDVSGSRLGGVLAGLAPSLDPVTRSRMAFFEIEAGDMPPDGSTGELLIAERVADAGAWVPLSALRQGPKGTWSLLTVRDGTVGIEAAEILHLDADRAYVQGTFEDGAVYLPTGTHRVVPGQAVTAEESTAWAR
ncbi:efflux RND transporter periplasmic adaptor subunit [Roseovarius aquimarinus]|uniref:Efflux RND transporter periplasmic adaptor subunit n=1 Tax=Roseovarius aquimarinus TaxID=1229156 RepID=A0ABW7I6L3_9RHOB